MTEPEATPTVKVVLLKTKPLTWRERLPTIRGIWIPDRKARVAKADTSLIVFPKGMVATLWFWFQSE